MKCVVGMHNRILSVITAIAVLLGLSFAGTFYAFAAGENAGVKASQNTKDGFNYRKYLEKHKDKPRPAETVEIDIAKIKSEKNSKVLDDGILLSPEEGFLEWEFNVKTAGMYNIRLTYKGDESGEVDIERELLINGELPFSEAGLIIFQRLWVNDSRDLNTDGGDISFKKDNNGNEIVPRQMQIFDWNTQLVVDQGFSYNGPLSFYFGSGLNSIKLVGIRESMLIKSISLTKCVDNDYDYQAYLSDNKGIEDYNGDPIMIQGEKACLKSAPVIYPLCDRSSSSTFPNDPTRLRLNTIGGSNWAIPGQWLDWEVDVPSDGMYAIGIKFRQNLVSGMISTRKLYINGQVPFNEVMNIEFKYNPEWKMHVIKANGEACKFHLKAGKNKIRLEVSIGRCADIYNVAKQSLLELDNAYRKIIMLTSTSPDPLRNYHLEKMLPEVIETFEKQAGIIEGISTKLKTLSGKKGHINTILDNIVYQLKSFVEKPITIPSRLYSYMQNVSGFASWILNLSKQPLEIDYIALSSPDDEAVKKLYDINDNFLKQLIFQVKAFLGSFYQDYSSIGSTVKRSDFINVWLNTGRDQASIIKRLIENDFSVVHDIDVNLKITGVGGGVSTLLLATVSGIGPDLAMTMGNAEPVNYAMRGAAVNLKSFPDFDEVIKRFMPSAMVPYEYNGGYYALPDSQQFPMLFYRKDIFEELNMTPPKTWDDMYRCIGQLQKNNMTIGIPSDMSFLATLVYQNGGSIYSKDKSKTMLDDYIVLSKFKQWTDLYSSYNLPVDYDAANRFRTGEMPFIITGYSFYNTITVFAPELSGMWDFEPIPGTVMPDGSLNNTAVSGGSCVMILSSSKKQKQSWEYLKWWTDAKTQLNYGRDIESLLGPAARIAPATVEVLKGLPWKSSEYSKLISQWQKTEAIPEVPGGYFTGRYIDNALRNVLTYKTDPREVLSEYALVINEEIAYKRDEFGLK